MLFRSSALLSTADGDWRGVILVGFYCGMRLNDACNLRWRDIDLVSPIKTITCIAQTVIRERKQKGRSVYSHSFHSLRHSFSTILANNNVSEEV